MTQALYTPNTHNMSIDLDLLPGVNYPPGVYMVNVSYTTYNKHNDQYSRCGSSFMTDSREGFKVNVYNNMSDLEYTIHCHNSFPTNPLFACRVSISVEHLFLLNLAHKLLKSPSVGP